jgi:predicted CXXCH cytochrome family protein
MKARLLRCFGACAVLALTAAGLTAVAQRQQDFPHEEHAGMFPLCEGCHQGVPEGDRAEFYPSPAQCAGCHDGTEQPRVEWQVPTEEPDNVVFTHPAHPDVDEQGGVIECTTCHTPAGAPRMAVAAQPVVPRCLDCHEHGAEDHYVDADCTTCHMPLAEAPFDRARLLALPEPADHDLADFLAEAHGHTADADIRRCAVCHTRERCEDCHVDAQAVNAIRAMPAAQGSVAAALPEYEARYPVPPSHLRSDFLHDHGTDASAASCSTCHTREDCTTCHLPPQPRAIADLTSRRDTRAPGVQTLRRAPPSHDAPLFEIEHGGEAAVNGASCSACHARTMCADCHAAAATDAAPASAPGAARGEGGRTAPLTVTAGDTDRTAAPSRMHEPRRPEMPGSFHPANFMARHSAEAYGRRLECSSCHDSRLFCADCHASAGMSPGTAPGRLGPGFHDAEPLWLLRHGQAARQGLESCTSCHAQNECMQCHSVLGAFKVSPHGPNFDARRAQKRNAAVCLICHITDPLNGRT